MPPSSGDMALECARTHAQNLIDAKIKHDLI